MTVVAERTDAMELTEWSTDTVAPTERFAYWREAVCDAFLDLSPESDRPRRFYGHITVERRPQLEIARVDSSAQHVRRQPSHDGGWCYLNYQQRGTGLTRQGDVAVRTAPGDAVLVRTDRPFEFRFDEAFCQLSVRLPAAISALVRRPLHLPATSGHGAALRALLGLSRVGSDRAGDDDSTDGWLDAAIVDLVRSALRADERIPRRSVRDLWPEIDRDIEAHLGSPALSPASTARRLGVSVRAVHLALESRPLTFAREVRERRLRRARSMLLDARLDGLRIRDIAADCGMFDVQHFHRTYRQTFGETPGTTRSTRLMR